MTSNGRHTTRNTGIGHLAARSLIEEIASLREDISHMGAALASIDLSLLLLFQEMRNSKFSTRRVPVPPPQDRE